MTSEKNIRGHQSIEVTGQILEALEQIRIPASLSYISKVTGMPQAKLHPYLVSMLRAEIVDRSAAGEYRIGNLPRELGFIGLHNTNPAQEADYFIKHLNNTTGHAVMVSVWGTLGPTITSFYNAKHEMYTELRIGSVMSMMNSSLGRTFSAFLPDSIVRDALPLEQHRNKGTSYTNEELDQFLNDIKAIRTRGYDVLKNSPLPELNSISAPVFGVSQNIELVITLSNRSSSLDLKDRNEIDRLINTTYELSKTIGYKEEIDY